MRIVSIATIAFALAACRHHGSQDNNEAQPRSGATSADLAMFAPAPSKDAARKVMHDRHEGMEAIGKANKLIKQELNASSPDLNLVRSSAYRMASLARDGSGWFARGTGPELGKTGARPEIWQNEADVAAKLSAFQKAAQAFADAVGASDAGAMKSHFANMDGTCKACHDKYRSQMHH
jgi:cytochrome c556